MVDSQRSSRASFWKYGNTFALSAGRVCGANDEAAPQIQQADQSQSMPRDADVGRKQHSVVLYHLPGQTPSGSAVSGPGLNDE